MSSRNITADMIWRVTYKDGSKFWEKDPNSGKEHLFKEINQSEIDYIDLIRPVSELDELLKEEVKTNIKNRDGDTVVLHFKTYHNESQPIFRLKLLEGQKLILARRHRKTAGQRVAVLGDPKLLDLQYRNEQEKLGMKIPPKPEQIGYPLEFPHSVIFIIGWQMNVNGKNIQSLSLVYPDGHVEMTGEYLENTI